MKPSIGRIVHFIQQKIPSQGSGNIHLPAIITYVHSETLVNLQVITDGANSEVFPFPNPLSIKWQPFVELDQTASNVGTWHWPEIV